MASYGNGGAFRDCCLDPFANPLHLTRGNERSHLGLNRTGIAHPQRANARREQFDEVRLQVLVNEDALD